MSSQKKLFLFGSPYLAQDGVIQKVSTRKAIAFLAHLALSGRVYSRQTLMSLFWSESDSDKAKSSLRSTLWALKNVVGEACLEVTRENIRFREDAVQHFAIRLWCKGAWFLSQDQSLLNVLFYRPE